MTRPMFIVAVDERIAHVHTRTPGLVLDGDPEAWVRADIDAQDRERATVLAEILDASVPVCGTLHPDEHLDGVVRSRSNLRDRSVDRSGCA